MDIIVFLLASISLTLSMLSGYIVARDKGQEQIGLLLGLVFGPLGVVFAGMLSDRRQRGDRD